MDYYSSIWAPTDTLMHYGILGMKWGIRRYQNKDGSLTAEGRKRLASGKKIRGLDEVAYKAYTKKEKEKETAKAHRENLKNAISSDDRKYIYDHIRNIAFYNDDRLKGILDKAARADLENEYAHHDWLNNKDLVKKTAKEYIKAKGKEEYAEYYLNLAGIDAAANVWSYYVSKNPKLMANDDIIWSCTRESKDALYDFYKKYLGSDKPARTMAAIGQDIFLDLVIEQADHIWRTE